MSREPQPPEFSIPRRTAGKADTAIPVETRDDSDEEERVKKFTEGSMAGRILAAVSPISVQQAGQWFLLVVAVAGWMAPGTYLWTHMQYGWGPCLHRQTLEVLRELAPQPAQPGGRPPILAPGRTP